LLPYLRLPLRLLLAEVRLLPRLAVLRLRLEVLEVRRERAEVVLRLRVLRALRARAVPVVLRRRALVERERLVVERLRGERRVDALVLRLRLLVDDFLVAIRSHSPLC
jgi:hypothetical protein